MSANCFTYFYEDQRNWHGRSLSQELSNAVFFQSQFIKVTRQRSLMMDSDFYITIFSIMVPIWFGIFAAFFFVIGLRGILTKRPFLLSSRWLLLVMFIGLIPAILIPVFLPGDSPFILKWLNPSIFTLLLVMMCFALKGYVAYAVTDTSFRDALLTSLQKLDLPHEETISTIRLTSVEVDLQVSVQSWICLLYTSPSPRDRTRSRMPSSA